MRLFKTPDDRTVQIRLVALRREDLPPLAEYIREKIEELDSGIDMKIIGLFAPHPRRRAWLLLGEIRVDQRTAALIDALRVFGLEYVPKRRAEPPAQADESENYAPAPVQAGEVDVTNIEVADDDGVTRSYPFHAAAANLNRLYNARERILTDHERRSVRFTLPAWEVDYIDAYREGVSNADRQQLTREDVIAEAMALFAATHPLPARNE